MARLGKAPTRDKLNQRPRRKVTLAMITYIPYIAGYYKDHMSITELSLQSAIRNAGKDREFDILIFDQGSCGEWKSRLASWHEAEYITDVHFSGHNIGKLGALHKIFSIVDSPIISYTDDDVLFYPDWLDQQMELIEEFPADLVTGAPILTRFKWYEKQVERFRGDKNYEVKDVDWGDYPKEWLEDDALGRGIPLQSYIEIIENATEGQVAPIQVYSKDHGAWAVGHHMQFTGVKESIRGHLPAPGRELMGVMREWDVAMDLGGLSQLATLQRTTRHLGNVMDNTIVSDAINMELVI